MRSTDFGHPRLRSAGGRPPRQRRWWIGARLAGWCLAIAGTVVGLRALESHVRNVRPPPTCRLDWVQFPPLYTHPDYQPVFHQIQLAAGVYEDHDIRDPRLVRRVGEGLLASPWVESVQRIRKQADGLISIHARFREPFAFVEHKNTAYLVDRKGVRLPSQITASPTHPLWTEFLRITGVGAEPPEEGQPWPGTELAAGLRLVEVLKEAAARGEAPFRASLRVVDVSNLLRQENALDSGIRIATVQPNSIILWGLPPGDEYPIEPAAKRKLDNLRTLYLSDGGQFPANTVLDVRKADAIDRWPYTEFMERVRGAKTRRQAGHAR